jgi:hypothetical protein
MVMERVPSPTTPARPRATHPPVGVNLPLNMTWQAVVLTPL